MNKIKYFTMLSALLATIGCSEAQIKNVKTESLMVYGNCGMCEKRIEAAARVSGEAKGDWDRDSKMIALTYDSTKTNADAILKRIADAGHDNVQFIANDQSYRNLPECCQYNRKTVVETPPPPNVETVKFVPQVNEGSATAPASEGKKDNAPSLVEDVKTQINRLLGVYYELKEALVASNSKTAAAKAGDFELALEKVDMNQMNASDHTFYMPLYEKLKADAKKIKTAKDLEAMRGLFDTFSGNMLNLVKHFEANKSTMYKQYCPMKKTYWISKEQAIRNPYYGDEMLECGSVKETIK